MLYYPKIPDTKKTPNDECVAFEKCDGTLFHFDWDKDFGWHALGTRRDSFNWTWEGVPKLKDAHPELSWSLEDSVRLVVNLALVERVFRTKYQGHSNFKVFAEFHGQNSFAGRHKNEDAKEFVIFDIMSESAGMIGPEEFIENFGGDIIASDKKLPIAKVIYKGVLTGQFAENVRNGKYDVVEGVVCKGTKSNWMAKIKTNAYMDKLKQSFAEDWEKYWET